MKKIAIVTGASRGLGRGIALILATEGNYSVYATARNADALNKLKEEVVSLGSQGKICLLYTSPSPRDRTRSRMPSSA